MSILKHLATCLKLATEFDEIGIKSPSVVVINVYDIDNPCIQLTPYGFEKIASKTLQTVLTMTFSRDDREACLHVGFRAVDVWWSTVVLDSEGTWAANKLRRMGKEQRELNTALRTPPVIVEWSEREGGAK